MAFCSQPFNRIEIYETGEVYNCCPPFINHYSIGNIYKNSFDEIWNSGKIKELRRKILNSDFSLCNDICNRKNEEEENSKYFSDTVEEYPEEISVSSDNACNVKCRICRDEHFHTKFDKDKLFDEVQNIWLPIFKNARVLRFGCSGEPFASYKEMLIMKEASKKYPDLKFHIHTNGILGDKEKLSELGIFDKIDTVTLSLHSASFFTYRKIIRGGNYFKVKNNIKLYSKMKQDGLLNNFRMIFVVYSENYKEMPKFVKLAKKNHAVAEFWALRPNDACEVGKNFETYSLLNKENKEYNKFVKVLKNPVFDEDGVILYPELKHLRDELRGN